MPAHGWRLADDCVSTPFSYRELSLRAQRLVAASSRYRGDAYGGLQLDPVTLSARRGGRDLALTPTEFTLLTALMDARQTPVARHVLYQRVWGPRDSGHTNRLSVYVGYLRRKLIADGEAQLIHTIRTLGYVLAERPSGAAEAGGS